MILTLNKTFILYEQKMHCVIYKKTPHRTHTDHQPIVDVLFPLLLLSCSPEGARINTGKRNIIINNNNILHYIKVTYLLLPQPKNRPYNSEFCKRRKKIDALSLTSWLQTRR